MISQPDQDYLDYKNWNEEYENEESGRIGGKQTPAGRTPVQGILSGNTMLANCNSNEFEAAIKAPKKERKVMKKSKRFKIFGSMRKAGTRNKNGNQVASDDAPAIEVKQYDARALGRRRYLYLRDVLETGDLDYRDASLPNAGNCDVVTSLPVMTQFAEKEDNFDWNDEDVEFLCKSSEYDSDLSNIDPVGYGSRSRSQSTHRSLTSFDRNAMHSQNRKNLLPHSRSRSHSSNRGTISRSDFVQTLQQAEQKTLNRLSDAANRSRSQSSHHSLQHVRSRSHSTHKSDCRMKTRMDIINNPSDENSGTLSRMVQNQGRNCIHESKRQQFEDNIFDDAQSHVSALSMTSPTEASNNKILKEMLSISFSENGKIANKKSKTKYKTSDLSFFCGLPSMKYPYDFNSDESSNDSNSDDMHSNVADLILNGEVLPATSSLTSYSTDVQNSEDDEDDDEIESSSDEEKTRQHERAVGYMHFEGAKKLLTIVQGKLSNCFVPATRSPPALHCKTMFA